MVYGISYIYEWLMVFVNGCISQWSGTSYSHLWIVVLMDITWSNDLIVLYWIRVPIYVYGLALVIE